MLEWLKGIWKLTHRATTVQLPTPQQTLEALVRQRLPQNTKVNFWLDDTAVQLDAFEDGILFILASWSGSSHLSLRTLADALKIADPDSLISVTIVDADVSSDLWRHPDFAGKLGGYGETAWYHAGQQIGFAKSGIDPDLYLENTRRLLSLSCEH